LHARRERDGHERIFEPEEIIWWDVEQNSDPVIFAVDLDPWTADREAFLQSVDAPQ
jgi:hypothetical protein